MAARAQGGNAAPVDVEHDVEVDQPPRPAIADADAVAQSAARPKTVASHAPGDDIPHTPDEDAEERATSPPDAASCHAPGWCGQRFQPPNPPHVKPRAARCLEDDFPMLANRSQRPRCSTDQPSDSDDDYSFLQRATAQRVRVRGPG
jgi:hypothetical protein